MVRPQGPFHWQQGEQGSRCVLRQEGEKVRMFNYHNIGETMKEEKKEYSKPEMSIIEFESESKLLAGSCQGQGEKVVCVDFE